MSVGTIPGVEEMRRSERVSKEVNIFLVGCDAQGKDFVEETKTVVLSRHGAGIVSRHKLATEQELVMGLSGGNEEVEIRVVGQIGAEGDSYAYGVAFLDTNVDFWGIEFPRASGGDGFEHRRLLECSKCGCGECVGLGALELDVYAIHDGLKRYCKRCGASTVWKVSSGPVQDETVPAPTAPGQSEPAPAPAPFRNRRRHVRTRVNFGALVRNGSSDDVAVCENVSSGGLCFRSSHRYSERADIEVAAPYSPGSPCILVSAQIVYAQELPEEQMFRYGVRYVPAMRECRQHSTP